MGQRTHFVIVAEDKIKNEGKVVIYYNHCGIGRVMPIALMSLVGNLKAHAAYYGASLLEFACLDYKHLGYSKEKEFKYKDGAAVSKNCPIKNLSDWRNAKIAGEYIGKLDNNNGCLFIFLNNSETNDWGVNIKKEIAWMIGPEDEYRCFKHENGERIERNAENKRLGASYEKWLTTRQWMSLDTNNNWWGKDPEFKELFNRFLAYFEILPLNKPRKAKNAA